MPKRFTDTDKWRKNWFSLMEPKHKLLWIYLLDNCDNAGFWSINIKLLNFEIGQKYTLIEIESLMVGKIEFVKEHILWIPKFIQFQYPKGLSESNKATNSVIKKLEYYGIEWSFENLKFRYKINNLQAPNMEPSSPCQGVQDKDKDKDKDKDIYIISYIIKSIHVALDKELVKYYVKTLKPSKLVQEKWLKKDTPKDIVEELEKFINHVAAKGLKYKKHSAAFSNWLKSPYRKKESSNGKHARTNGSAQRETIPKDYTAGAPKGWFANTTRKT